MFEKFGLLDVFAGLFRHIKWYVSSLIILLGASILLWSSLGTITSSQEEVVSFTSSSSYLIHPLDDLSVYTTSENNTDVFYISNQLAAFYNQLLYTDFCQQYVFEYISGYYSEEQLLELFRNAESDITSELSMCFNSEIISNTSIIKMLAKAPDLQLSQIILQSYESFFTSQLDKINPPAIITYLDGVTSSSVNSIVTENALYSIVKILIGVFVLTSAMYCIAVFIIVLLFPVLNRKSDFFAYKLPVITEIYKAKRGNNPRTINREQQSLRLAMMSMCNLFEKSENVVLLSSCKNSMALKTFSSSMESLLFSTKLKCAVISVQDDEVIAKMYSDGKLYHEEVNVLDIAGLEETIASMKAKCTNIFIFAPPINMQTSAIQISRLINNLVLVEKYGKLDYKTYEDTLYTLEQFEISPQGVISYL